MEPATTALAGGVLALFGAGLLLWCAAELRVRRRLRRHGIPVAARVLPDESPVEALDPAPLLSFTTLASVGGAEGRDGSEPVRTRPRGSTALRRPAGLLPGSSVRVCYDPRRPARVVLTGVGTAASLPLDVFWTILGTSSLAAGLSLLASVFAV
ncbi:DUF3592 domain-containing protein [Kitasatospora sp. NPDC052896]|uniref:DUF3592 domain-containing protein n=1 Tax=Kitasatospora sp. NPDC052896 TaxID=3364061 RepID=UPI0037CB46D5